MDKVKISLAGINLSPRSGTPRNSGAAGTGDEKDKKVYIRSTDDLLQAKETVALLSPPPAPIDGPKFLRKAIERKRLSFEERLAALPTAPTDADYKRMSVEKFGEAAMRSMSPE